jgi:DNA-binding Lrp family transcriptional regulator
MMSALVLVECDQSFIPMVKADVQKIGRLDYLYHVKDTYSLILKVSAANKEKLRDKVTEIINLQSVESTTSLIIL